MGDLKLSSINPCVLLVFTVVLQMGCGGGSGGLGADIPVVTPLDGDWSSDTGENWNFDGFSQEELYFSEVLYVSVAVNDAQNTCDAPIDNFGQLFLNGTIQHGRIHLFAPGDSTGSACMTGIFTDLRTLRVDAANGVPIREFKNTRVDVDLEFGLWVSSDEGSSISLVFNSPGSVDNDSIGGSETAGCLLIEGGYHINFTGLMNGFDTNTGDLPVIPELRTTEFNNLLLFTQLVYVDNVTITLRDAQQHQRTLVRIPNFGNTKCPFV